MIVRIGTRASRLARIQSGQIGGELEAAGHAVEYVVIKTAGDRSQGLPFAAIGAPGVFVREIESALIERRIDLAVHSYKDLPSQGTAGLTVAAVPPRLDPADLLLARPGSARRLGFLPLAPRARVGTASKRREVWLQHLRPDLSVLLLRGNLTTRLRRLQDGDFDAIVLAAAGLARLEQPGPASLGKALALDGVVRTRLDPEIFVPAPSQGALALQVREPDGALREVMARFNHPESERAVGAERVLQHRVEGGCSLPFGAWCRGGKGRRLELIAMLGTDGGPLRVRAQGTDPEALAETVWQELRGGAERAR